MDDKINTKTKIAKFRYEIVKNHYIIAKNNIKIAFFHYEIAKNRYKVVKNSYFYNYIFPQEKWSCATHGQSIYKSPMERIREKNRQKHLSCMEYRS